MVFASDHVVMRNWKAADCVTSWQLSLQHHNFNRKREGKKNVFSKVFTRKPTFFPRCFSFKFSVLIMGYLSLFLSAITVYSSVTAARHQ